MIMRAIVCGIVCLRSFEDAQLIFVWLIVHIVR
jgi:hypothetical protein